MMDYVHVKNLEKYHPGYKDRKLQWAKIYFDMVKGDPACEMIEDETDWGRLIKFIILELRAQEPIPINDRYLTLNGFELEKRPISLTVKMLHNFIDIVTDKESCDTQKSKMRVLDKEEDKEKNKIYMPHALKLKKLIEQVSPSAKITEGQLNSWCNDFRLMIEQDKRTPEQVNKFMDAVFMDHFWKDNIKSMGKLRLRINEGKLDKLMEKTEGWV